MPGLITPPLRVMVMLVMRWGVRTLRNHFELETSMLKSENSKSIFFVMMHEFGHEECCGEHVLSSFGIWIKNHSGFRYCLGRCSE